MILLRSKASETKLSHANSFWNQKQPTYLSAWRQHDLCDIQYLFAFNESHRAIDRRLLFL